MTLIDLPWMRQMSRFRIILLVLCTDRRVKEIGQYLLLLGLGKHYCYSKRPGGIHGINLFNTDVNISYLVSEHWGEIHLTFLKRIIRFLPGYFGKIRGVPSSTGHYNFFKISVYFWFVKLNFHLLWKWV